MSNFAILPMMHLHSRSQLVEFHNPHSFIHSFKIFHKNKKQKHQPTLYYILEIILIVPLCVLQNKLINFTNP